MPPSNEEFLRWGTTVDPPEGHVCADGTAVTPFERGEIRKYREESARREKSEPGRVTNFGASLMAALSSPNKAAKSTR